MNEKLKIQAAEMALFAITYDCISMPFNMAERGIQMLAIATDDNSWTYQLADIKDVVQIMREMTS